eukprot:3386554-Prorocentrum_lima.AAC.1
MRVWQALWGFLYGNVGLLHVTSEGGDGKAASGSHACPSGGCCPAIRATANVPSLMCQTEAPVLGAELASELVSVG